MTAPAANLGSRPPWFQVWRRSWGWECACERCHYSGSATWKALETTPDAIAREAVWHGRCQER